MCVVCGLMRGYEVVGVCGVWFDERVCGLIDERV